MTPARTIVVAHASIGSGHRIAAEAIVRELTSRNMPDTTVEILDVLEFASSAISGDMLTKSFTGPTARLYDAAWSNPSVGRVARLLSGPILSLRYATYSQRLRELAPDAIVCTHALPATLALRAYGRDGRMPPLVNVATDYGVHGYWPVEQASLTCVADTASFEQLVERGMPSARLAVTGIPLRRQFALEYDRDAALKHFGLGRSGRIILALAGASMNGPYTRLKEALAVSLPALASIPGASLVLVCGRDTRFVEEMKVRAAGFGASNVHVMGFVDQIAPLMACADLGIAKPGGSACAEAMASGLPLVLVGPAAGQERANAQALSDAGAAVFSPDPQYLAEKVRKALADPASLDRMRQAASEVGHPFAAADIVDRVLELTDR